MTVNLRPRKRVRPKPTLKRTSVLRAKVSLVRKEVSNVTRHPVTARGKGIARVDLITSSDQDFSDLWW